MNLGVPGADERRIEVCFGGAQLTVDTTFRSIPSWSWWWWPLRLGAAGVTSGFLVAIGAGERTRGAGTLVPLGRVGLGRWTRMIGTACAVSFAESLVEPSESGGDVPSLASLVSHDPRQINCFLDGSRNS